MALRIRSLLFIFMLPLIVSISSIIASEGAGNTGDTSVRTLDWISIKGIEPSPGYPFSGSSGHYWIEILDDNGKPIESYGWFPTDLNAGLTPADTYVNAIVGVPGVLNAGRKDNQDPVAIAVANGEASADWEYHPVLTKTLTDQEVLDKIHDFVKNYKGNWEVLFRSCHTFQKDLMNNMGLVEPVAPDGTVLDPQHEQNWPARLHPTVQSFDVSARSLNSGESLEIAYTVSDNGGLGLKQVELWRKDESSDWQQIKITTLLGENGPVSGSFTDSPSAPAKYWYGVHVVDKAGNWNDEKNSNTKGLPSGFEPTEVEVLDKQRQSTTTQGSNQAVPSEAILFAGIPLKLKDGYELTLKSLDIDGNKIYLELSKDGQVVDSSVIRPPNNVAATYSYYKDKEQAGAVPIIKVHFKNSFHRADQNIATLDSIWQTSESNPSNVIRNSNEAITLTSAEPLKLEEGYELSLKTTDIDGNKIYVELSKDGQVVDSSVIIPSNGFDEAYSYTKNKGQADAIQVIKVHFEASFRGSNQDIATINSIWQASESNPSNVIRNSNEETILTSAEPLKLEEGYELSLKTADIGGSKIYVELSKDGQVVGNSVILPSNSVKPTYTYIKNRDQTGAVPIIKVHFKNSFRGADQSIATIDSIWQVSESNPSNVIRNSNGMITLTSAEPLRLEEGYELSLKTTDISGNKINVKLSKDGKVVDSRLVAPGDILTTDPLAIDPLNGFCQSYTYIIDKTQAKAMPIIVVHFKNSFRGADQSIATIDSIWQVSESNPSNLIRNSNDAIMLTLGEPLRLEEGYELSVKSIDSTGNKTYVELSKNGQVVDDLVIFPSNNVEATYTYTNDKEKVGSMQPIVVHFKNSFRGEDMGLATIVNSIQPTETSADNDPILWYRKGSDLNCQKRYDEAIRAYEKAIELDPKMVYAWYKKGETLYLLERYDEALTAFEKTVELAPNSANAWYKKSDILYVLDRYNEALQAYERTIELAPNWAYAWYGKGNTLYFLSRYDEALTAYEKAIELDQNMVNAWCGKGAALYSLSRYDEALTAYEKAIELDQNMVNAWCGKGNTLNLLGRYDEALKAFEKAIELTPNSAKAWDGKGSALWMQNKEDEALTAYEKAIELDPNLPNGWNGKGTVFQDQGKYNEAIKCFEKAIELEPKSGVYWSNKGDALKAIGDNDEANIAYAKAKELGYVNPGYKTLIKERLD